MSCDELPYLEVLPQESEQEQTRREISILKKNQTITVTFINNKYISLLESKYRKVEPIESELDQRLIYLHKAEVK